MSNLGNLFTMGGASDESNNLLKYSAPKEPKKKVTIAKVAPEAAEAKPTVTAVPQQAHSNRQPGPSKVMASATVRLYKMNQCTRAYEPVEGGAPLGCAILGMGLTYQILVYNGQKVPQAAVNINAAFDYTVRDLYVSFADSSSNFWSLLFDNFDSINTCLRIVAAIIFHINTHTEGNTTENLRRLLPRAVDAGAEPETVLLATGMAAGVFVEVFEVGELADYPSDIFSATIKAVRAPDDVLKLKVGGNDIIPGLGSALVGLGKGDRCMIGISPKAFYQSSSSTNGWIGMADRRNRATWLVVQLEVVKIKSNTTADSTGSSKKDKKRKDSPSTPTTAAAAITIEDSSPTPLLASASADDGKGGNDITARMARISAQAGGGKQALANIINPKQAGKESAVAAVVTVAMPLESTALVPYANAEADEYNDQLYEKEEECVEPPPPQQKSQPAVAVKGRPQPVRANSQQQHQQQYNHNQQDSAIAQKEAMYASAINAATSASSPAYAEAMVIENPQSSAQQQQYFNQFQQSMMILQQSMMQMHNKLDQVGMQVGNTFSIVQQQSQQSQQLSMYGGGGGMGMGMGMGMNNMNNGMPGNMGGGMQQQPMMLNMNNMMQGLQGYYPNSGMSPMHSVQQQQQMFNNNNNYNNNNNPVRMKTEELVATAQFLLQQHDQMKQENTGLQQQLQQAQQVMQQQQALVKPDNSAEYERQILELKSKVIMLETSIATTKEEKELVVAERDALTNQLSATKETLAAAQSTVDLSHPKILAFIEQRLREQATKLSDDSKLREAALSSEINQLKSDREGLQGKIISLEAALEEEKQKLVPASVVIASEPPTFATPSISVEEMTTLQDTIVELGEKLAAAMSDNEQLKNSGMRFTDEDMKQVVQEVFVNSQSTFLTAEEIESIDDERKRETMVQVTKLHLRRLKEVLRQISATRLAG